MESKITKHNEFMSREIRLIEIEDIIDQKKKSLELLNFHQAQTSNFQHERLVHLFVTLFFGGLTIVFILVQLFVSFQSNILDFIVIYNILTAIIAILFVVEIFYVRHYYKLENKIQKLYDLNLKIFTMTVKS